MFRERVQEFSERSKHGFEWERDLADPLNQSDDAFDFLASALLREDFIQFSFRLCDFILWNVNALPFEIENKAKCFVG